MSGPDPLAQPLADLLRAAAAHPAPEQARARFLHRLDAEREQRRRLPRGAWLGLPALAAAAALAALLFWPRPALDYVVEGAMVEGGYVRAGMDGSATVRFSDGTGLTLARGARVRIEAPSARGARISLEDGALETHVVHAPDTDYRFLAGPFSVRVTGTRFRLTWDARGEVLEVRLTEGSVEIDGFGRARPVALVAGQRFVGDARRRSLLVEELGAAPPASAAAAPAPLPAATAALEPHASPESHASLEPRASDAPAPRGARQGSEPAVSWSSLVAQAEFARVVREAEARGTSRCLRACSAADLTALSDAARYTGRARLAESALLALRERFGAGGGRAAYMLGRLYEAEGRRAEARQWYATSLREAPEGPFRAEASAGQARLGGQAASP
jgi:hypothetical protein